MTSKERVDRAAKAGSTITPAKQKASAENGRRGGRPRKTGKISRTTEWRRSKKDKKKRKKVEGLLPKGMNAKSLRRTFGSLVA